MVCLKCKADKPPEEFVLEKRNVIRLRKSWCKTCTYATTKIWKNKNRSDIKNYQLEYDLFRLYALTIQDYNSLLHRQNGQCAICSGAANQDRRGFRLSVDHCHTTDRIRGLLCMTCNHMLGKFNDDPKLFMKAAAYLERDEVRTSPFE